MASINARRNKYGQIVSYTIRVYRGYDSSGKHLKPYSMTWKLPEGMSAKKAEKEVGRIAAQFEDECLNGMRGTAENLKLADFASVYLSAVKDRLSPVVLSSYARILDTLILPALGHADFTTTHKYLHLVEQADAEAVDGLEALLEKRNA